MKKAIDFFRKMGLLHVSKGDSLTGEFDDRRDLKKKKESGDKKSEENKSDNAKKGKQKRSIWAWLFGGLFLLLALIFVFSSFWSAIVLLLSAVLIFPSLVKITKRKWNFELSKKGKIATGVVGLVLSLVLMGGSEMVTAELEIQNGDSDPEDVIKAGQILVELVEDLQDAQLSTVALLSVKFETADKDDYLDYIEEVEEKWEDVEHSAKKLEKIKKMKGETPPISVKDYDFSLARVAQAEVPSEIEFNPALSSDFSSGEVELGNEMIDNIFDRAQIHRRLSPESTAIGYLMEHCKVTAKEAKKMLDDYNKTVSSSWDNAAKLYDAASKTAQGIATASKVSLYVLGTVSSFGAAAAAQTGTGVILGYVGGGWGMALGGVDIALDIAEGASTVSTGKGLANYKKDKAFIGKANMIFGIVNIAKLGATGIPKFDGDDFQVADDILSISGMVGTGKSVYGELSDDKLSLKMGDGVKIPEGTAIGEIIKAYHKKGFEYNKVVLSVVVDEEGDISIQEVETSSNDSCQPDEDSFDVESGKLIKVDYWWPACDQGFLSRQSCQHLPNTCLSQGRCVCREGYKSTTGEDERAAVCVTDEEQMLLLSDHLGRMREIQCNSPGADPFHWACNKPPYEKSAEVEELEKRLEKEKEGLQKAWSCGL